MKERERSSGRLRAPPLEDEPDSVYAESGEESVDLVVDNVAGEVFPEMLALLRRGGRYVSSGAIGGPKVTMDMRTVYLKDLAIVGTTAWDEQVFPSLISYVERGEIRPLVAKTFSLAEIASAQREFLSRQHVGKFVLLPPAG